MLVLNSSDCLIYRWHPEFYTARFEQIQIVE